MVATPLGATQPIILTSASIARDRYSTPGCSCSVASRSSGSSSCSGCSRAPRRGHRAWRSSSSFTFVSSAYVRVEALPGWMQGFAQYQPVTPSIGTDVGPSSDWAAGGGGASADG